MQMTLAGAKPKLEMDLNKAFYDAYMTQYEDNKVSEAGKYNGDIRSALDKKAHDFADSMAKDMAEAIYSFVKEIGIMATVSGTVIAPSGPCTGVIPMNGFTVS